MENLQVKIAYIERCANTYCRRKQNSKFSSSKYEVIEIIQSCFPFFRESTLVSVVLHFARNLISVFLGNLDGENGTE